MTETNIIKPDYIFEVSWEVCNKVGGIYTVISTKALKLAEELKDNYITIGPDVWKETDTNPEFVEDKFLYRSWREYAEKQGLKIKIGRWNISGNPVAILVEFTHYFAEKDRILTDFWVKNNVDSLDGQWDYVEPALFGYAAARVIECFYEYNLSSTDKIIAQFHEWMTGTGVLYLNDKAPQVGTVFTTHATVLGRCIAGNGLPLYNELNTYNPDVKARDFNVVAKHSLERQSAVFADCFTTVSDLTANECTQFLGKSVNLTTPNGFNDNFVPKNEEFDKKREIARNKLLSVSEALLLQELPKDSFLIVNSGRYEFKNKGIDLFIDSLGKLNNNADLKSSVIAFITVPAGHKGPRKDLLERINSNDKSTWKSYAAKYTTHKLFDSENDPVLKRIKENNLNNTVDDKVKIIFVPSYLNENDGIFDLDYYELLIGMDLSVFPSYYEPWGYTPLESLAFHVPTVTTTLTGFGVWAKAKLDYDTKGINVVFRDDFNDSYVVEQIEEIIFDFTNLNSERIARARSDAYSISHIALWDNLVTYYHKTYSIALEKAGLRKDLYKHKQQPEHSTVITSSKGGKPTWKKVLVKSEIPEKLSALHKISSNLWWSWNFEAIELFEMIDPLLWKESKQNPILLLKLLSVDKYKHLETNKVFINKMNTVLHKFEDYLKEAENKPKDMVAYFSMEFGMHDTLKIFSGGLGVLAGDYLKEASDSNYNMVGIGLLYRYGYFHQDLSVNGEQLNTLIPQKFLNMPVHPVMDEDGKWKKVSIALPGRTLIAKIWRVDVGRIPLYLLDTDIEENSEEDKLITSQLYGGNWENRLKQEILLGVGGIRLLDTMNIKPDIYHCNEGHAAFIGLERLRKYVQNDKLSFHEAREVVRASSLFTTHTPVPAGHDAFIEDLLRTYIPHYAERLNISWESFMSLGKLNVKDPHEKFSMSVLAAKLSQEINGVSRIHGDVTRKMFNNMWSSFFPEELHIGYVTNGVHFKTWTSRKMQELYQKEFGYDFTDNILDGDVWKKIWNTPDESLWKIRQYQRKELIDYLKVKLTDNLTKRQENPKLVFETIESLNENALTIGFARRFATYKRAHLLFSNIEKLSELINNKERPIQFIFAGKAHPQDKAGQDLIKHIIEISKRKEFIGKIVFVENYDIALAKKLVQGVDVWLNTPTRPLEASGTSGEKAIMNGVLNLSVLDGWWAEGYVPNAGWALKEEATYTNNQFQDDLDAETIYNLLEDEIIPMFYLRDDKQVPFKWVSFMKNNIAEICPRFTTKRMINDYDNQYYKKLFARNKLMTENTYEMARQLSQWKKKIIRGWESIEVVEMEMPDYINKSIMLGESFKAKIVLDLNELSQDDIGVEVIFGQKVMDEVKEIKLLTPMQMVSSNGKHVTYQCEIPTTNAGVFDFAFRIYAKHSMLPHRQDFDLVRWL